MTAWCAGCLFVWRGWARSHPFELTRGFRPHEQSVTRRIVSFERIRKKKKKKKPYGVVLGLEPAIVEFC